MSGEASFVSPSMVSWLPQGAAFLPGNREILTTLRSRSGDRLGIWDLGAGKVIREFAPGDVRDGIRAVAVSADGRWALSGSSKGTITLWDVGNGKPVRSFGEKYSHIGPCEISSVFFSRDERFAIAVRVDGCIREWEIATGRAGVIFNGFEKTLFAISPDGTVALSAGQTRHFDDNSPLTFWSVAAGKPVRTFGGHRGSVMAAVFTPDGKRVLSAGRDNVIAAWEAATGRQLWSWQIGTAPFVMTAVAFSPDGKRALVGRLNGALRLLDVDKRKLLRVIAPGRPEPEDEMMRLALAEAIALPDANGRLAAIEALGKIGTAVVPAIAATLTASDVTTRRKAARMLSERSADARAAIPALWGAIQDADADVRVYTAKALWQAERPSVARLAPALIKGLRAASVSARLEGLTVLKDLPLAPDKAFPVFAESLKDPDVRVRRRAASSLSHFLASNRHREVHRVVPALMEALKDPDGLVRKEAVRMLHGLGDEADPAVTALSLALKDKSVPVKVYAADALLQLGEKPADALVIMNEGLQDSDQYVRSVAVDCLGRFGRKAQPAIPALVQLLRTPDRSTAGVPETLGRIGPPAVPALLECLKDQDKGVRSLAVSALWHMGSEAEAAIPALIEVMRDKKARSPWGSSDREQAARALEHMGPRAKAAVGLFAAIIQDESEEAYLRVTCMQILPTLEAAPKDVVPALLTAAKDANLRGTALSALSRIDPAAAAAVLKSR
jgi:HEAT repeat protein